MGMGNFWPASKILEIISIAQIVRYCLLSLLGSAPSSIASYLSAVAYVHKISNWPDPTCSFVVTKMKEGRRRLEPHRDFRCPITFEILSKLVSILPSVCHSGYEVSLFKAAFLLAFFGFLRVSELTCCKKDMCSTRAICVGDISFVKEGD